MQRQEVIEEKDKEENDSSSAPRTNSQKDMISRSNKSIAQKKEDLLHFA